MSILYIVSDNNAMVWIGGVVCYHPAGSHHLVSLYYIYSISQLIQLITKLKIYIMTKEPCTCGKTTELIYTEEGQHQPECWDCFLKEESNFPPVGNLDHLEDELPF
jgi:hypothetical protein